MKFMCSSCDEKVHQGLLFHNRDAFVNGYFNAIPPTVVIDSRDDWLGNRANFRGIGYCSIILKSCDNDRAQQNPKWLHPASCLPTDIDGRPASCLLTAWL